jgi:Fe(3+) dicitrate transport protein
MITEKLSANTGFRMEMGKTQMTGDIVYYADSLLPNTILHHFPLLGLNVQYEINGDINFYGGWSQAYRPVIFKDIIPASIYEAADKNLKDAYGYNLEVGFRGKWKFVRWDVTAFQLQYNNRMGTLARMDSAGNLTFFRTNIGNSRTNGLELFIQSNFLLFGNVSLTVFSSTSYMDARYQDAVFRSGNVNVNVDGNKVESVPEWISRNGLTIKNSFLSFSALYSYTAGSYADPLNTYFPNKSGSIGYVPAYQLVDLNVGLRLSESIRLECNASNIFDVHYFTKRPQFYPGPGIWPSDGRTFSVSVNLKM